MAGIDAQSGPNVVAYDLVAQQQGPQNITSKYLDSKTQSFNLKSFYLGCLVSTQETATSLPGACDISLTGYRNGKQTATKTVSFKPSAARSKMQFFDLGKKFWDVDTVAFKTKGVLQSTLLGVLFDNIAYDVVLKN